MTLFLSLEVTMSLSLSLSLSLRVFNLICCLLRAFDDRRRILQRRGNDGTSVGILERSEVVNSGFRTRGG